MRVRNGTRRPGRFALGVIAAIAVALAPGVVLAYSGFGSDWEAAHPGSTSYASADCELCHGGSNDTWNAYGWALRVEYQSNGEDMPAAIAAVDPANSDADFTGSKNAAEAGADTQPGWTYGPKNTIYDSGGTPTNGQLPPNGIGLLDPVILVTISDDAFTPAVIAPKLGGGVQWIRGSGSHSHNVAEVSDIFRSGAPTTGAIFYNRIFSAGTFSYESENFTAMDGTVKVKPKTSAKGTGATFTVTWATTKTNTGTKFNVQYKVGTGVWKSWLSNSSLKKAVFGASGSPIVPKAGTKYSFRVQSGTGTAWSGYSPQKAFVAA